MKAAVSTFVENGNIWVGGRDITRLKELGRANSVDLWIFTVFRRAVRLICLGFYDVESTCSQRIS